MKKFLAKRVLSVIPVLFVVSVIIFSLVHLVPGDPASAMLGDMATEADVAALRTRMGLDRSLPEQYVVWVANIFRGDLGSSVVSNETAATMIISHIQPTVSLALYSLIISAVIAVPLGIVAARYKRSVVDHGVTVLSLAGISLPSFLLGLFLMLLFAVKLRWFPVSGFKELKDGFIPHIRSLTLPAIALGFMNAALMMRMTRASMLEVLNSDYIKMAKAKGVRDFTILVKHALKNTMVTLITVFGQSIVTALAGAAVVESLFAVPGLGQLMVNSIGRRDYYVIQAIVLLIAVFNVLINMLIDILYGVVDPRVRVN
ncbi:MAG: ABC transporter permease [Lacrimispora sp.]|uniref:ABC transporter permease n=1 Tax=Lacrimispora sp. TaxID=2719234 RepID=UPI0039E44012